MILKFRTYKCEFAPVLDIKRKVDLNISINRRVLNRYKDLDPQLRFHLTTIY